MAETLPDIQNLFRHYNALYFDDALGACIVNWAPRMRRSIGTCRYIEAGHCEIHMSKPLLKLRSSSDLKNSLLHEMVHAFLWIKRNNKSRSRHDNYFWAKANEINSSCKNDDQRPCSGYNISDQHMFHDEAETATVHHWMCKSCGHVIKRDMDRGSCSPSDPGGDCGNLSCEWHRHKKLCSGLHNKAGISGFRGKQRTVEGAQENDGGKLTDITHVSKQTRRIQPAEDLKPISITQKKSTNLCSSVSAKTKSSENLQKYQITCKQKKCNEGSIEKNKSSKRKREVSLIIPWLGVCTDEESEEDKEPLINKRSVKRMKLKESEERARQIALTHEIIYLD
ncbi:hypothetical protein KFK09_008962 [Dendrobium nobile]|uniref:SprT-like domain-containing protein n=1 Tax=Dendrobium nobile TaxID=94219 RepID=A0A8T3BRD9_DENNO|nr:hypothetical protein KFK09_008962 [Dendrobium nobile]